jgi:hypothetical protein
MTEDRIELEEGQGLDPVEDRRPRVPEPLPVRLVAVADVTLPATCGLEVEIDEFYVGVLRFVREAPYHEHVYRADNFRVRFELHEGLVHREGYRPLGIEVQSLVEAENKLIERQIEYVKQRTLVPGQISLALLDPAGNPLELVEERRIMW